MVGPAQLNGTHGYASDAAFAPENPSPLCPRGPRSRKRTGVYRHRLQPIKRGLQKRLIDTRFTGSRRLVGHERLLRTISTGV